MKIPTEKKPQKISKRKWFFVVDNLREFNDYIVVHMYVQREYIMVSPKIEMSEHKVFETLSAKINK